MSLFLSDKEVQELTRKQRHAAQSRALSYMGIEHKIRPDGTVAVLRSLVDRHFGDASTNKPKRKTEPRLDLVL